MRALLSQILPFLRQNFLKAPLEVLDPLSLFRGVFSSVFLLPDPGGNRSAPSIPAKTKGGMHAYTTKKRSR